MVTHWSRLRRRVDPGALVLAAVWASSALLCAATLLPRAGVARAGAGSGPALRLTAEHKFSDAVQLPGTDTLLLVDDDARDLLHLWRVGALGEADGEPRPVELPPGVQLEDGEGITTDGRFVYAISSHSLTQDGKRRRNVLLQMRWKGNRLELEAVVGDLQASLESAFPALAEVRGLLPDQGGLNIEGLAWDPRNERLLLGLRGPLLDGRAAVVPFRLTQARGRRNIAWDGPPMRIPGIEGVGIRSIQYDPEGDSFVILTGGVGRAAAGAAGGNRFVLWRWSGTADQAAVSLTGFPDTIEGFEIKPEGVCPLTLPGGGSFLLVVSDDAPYYWKLDARAQGGVQAFRLTGGAQ